MTPTYVTEQCGARWTVIKAGAGRRAFWVTLVSGKSAAKPGVVGFYAASIDDACNALNN